MRILASLGVTWCDTPYFLAYPHVFLTCGPFIGFLGFFGVRQSYSCVGVDRHGDYSADSSSLAQCGFVGGFFPIYAIFALVSDHLRNFCFYSWASLSVLPSLLRLPILLSLSPLVTSLGGQGCSPPSLVVPVVFALGEFISVAAVLCLLPPPAGVMSALADPPWCVCSASLGTPEVFTLGVMQLAALLGFPCCLTQVDCSTPAVMVSLGVGALSCHSCTVSPLFSCWGGCCFAPCVRVFQLRCYLLGLQVGFPCCLFLTLGGCTSGYGVSRVCGLRRRFRLPFVVLHPLPVSVGPSPFSGVGVFFGHALVAPPATPGFGLF